MGKKQSSKDGEYRVRDILDFKQEGGEEFLLIWWQGYPKREATWQPAQNMRHLLDFNQYYESLKQQYNQRNEQPVFEEGEQSHSHHIHSSQLPHKTKQIVKKQKKDKSQKQQSVDGDRQMSQRQVVQHPVDGQIQRGKENNRNGTNAAGEMSKQQLKKRIKEARPVQFQVNIKLFKNLPYAGQEIRSIRQAAQTATSKRYQVEFHNISTPQPIVLNEDYLRVMWPRQFCEFLLSKSR